MTDRMSALDASFLYLDDRTTPMHVGSVMIFDPPAGGFDPQVITDLIAARIAGVRRYRQRVVEVPGHLANPVWSDDKDFDLGYHVRASGLPRPGNDEQLEEFVARIASRPLDPARPLWEAYLVEGLERGRFAIVTKTHHALVDGVNAVDLAQLILSVDIDEPPGEVDHDWRPKGTPSTLGLITDAALEAVRRPTQVIETVRGGLVDVKATAGRIVGAAATVVSTVARASARPAPTSPLNVEVSAARRFVMVGTDLSAYRTVQKNLLKGRFAEDVTVNDVVLATIAGALRTWMLTRGEAVNPATTVRAMVPVSFHNDADPRSGPELSPTGVQALFVDLPVGEPGASMRLHQIAFAMRQQMEGGSAVPADAIAGLGGFAPPTLHALGARLGGAVSRRLYNLVITNVPGPQQPLYAAGARLVSSYPVMPLGRGQGIAIGLTSYDGGVYYGINADRDGIPDADVLGQSITDALGELLETHRTAPVRRPR